MVHNPPAHSHTQSCMCTRMFLWHACACIVLFFLYSHLCLRTVDIYDMSFLNVCASTGIYTCAQWCSISVYPNLAVSMSIYQCYRAFATQVISNGAGYVAERVCGHRWSPRIWPRNVLQRFMASVCIPNSTAKMWLGAWYVGVACSLASRGEDLFNLHPLKVSSRAESGRGCQRDVSVASKGTT